MLNDCGLFEVLETNTNDLFNVFWKAKEAGGGGKDGFSINDVNY
jgi:hypothetical protein